MRLRLCALALGCAALCAAEARVVYVTPSGAGAKDGTSWANAYSSLATAYTNAADGATTDAPGEVWMQYGGYMLPDRQYGIEMKPNVVVRGGFLGTEADAAAADPTNNPTVLYNNRFDVNETWLDGSKMWTRVDGRLRFFDPPAEGGWSNVSQGHQCAFSHTNKTETLGVAEFHGLTFTKFWSSAILVETSNERPIKVRNCRFLNIGRLTNNWRFMIHLVDTSLDMDGCEFVAGFSPVLVKTTSQTSDRRTATIRNSRFFSTYACWNTAGLGGTSGGVLAFNNVALTIRDCTFAFNKSGGNNGAPMASALSVLSMAPVLVEDTVVRNGVGTMTRSGGAFVYTSVSNSTLTVRRSRFENNCYRGSMTAHETQAAAVTLLGDLAGGRTPRATFENVAFLGNWTTNTTKGCESASCIAFGGNNYQQSGRWKANFVNCLFERNESFNSWTNGSAGATICYSWTQGPRPVFVNCVFKDNLCGKYAEDYTRTVGRELGYHENSLRTALVNTIFENTEGTSIPWDAKSVREVLLANVVTDADVPMATTWSDRYRYAPCVANATNGFETALLTNGVVVARRLSGQSAYRKKGRPVWAGTDGEYYLYDADGDAAKPWRSCRFEGARLTDADALAVGVSWAAAPVPDAFGIARKAEKCALGQLEPKVQGLLLIVR